MCIWIHFHVHIIRVNVAILWYFIHYGGIRELVCSWRSPLSSRLQPPSMGSSTCWACRWWTAWATCCAFLRSSAAACTVKTSSATSPSLSTMGPLTKLTQCHCLVGGVHAHQWHSMCKHHMFQPVYTRLLPANLTQCCCHGTSLSLVCWVCNVSCIEFYSVEMLYFIIKGSAYCILWRMGICEIRVGQMLPQ